MTHLAEIWAPEPQNNSKSNDTNFTRGHMGQIKVIRCFVQFFYMAAYVTKAGLGPEPEFALLCRSFFRWSSLVFSSSQSFLKFLIRTKSVQLLQLIFVFMPLDTVLPGDFFSVRMGYIFYLFRSTFRR